VLVLIAGAVISMNKFWDRISNLENVSYKELAENLYEVLVLEGGHLPQKKDRSSASLL